MVRREHIHDRRTHPFVAATLAEAQTRAPAHPRGVTMIFEIRTYRLKVGSLAEVEKRFSEAYQHRKKHSELWGFFHTEIGPLNQIVHIWPYENLEERTRIRAEAAKDGTWPPKTAEFITQMESEILIPYGFVPPARPGKLGPMYEMRAYTFKAGSLPDIMKRWEAKVPERMKISPAALAGYTELGGLNKHVHIWPYPSLDQRAATRAKAIELGVWPPPGGADTWLTQENKVLIPSSFSPLQ